MANLKAVFSSLADFATGAGVALHKVLEGDTHTGKNASAALSFKDAAGNLIYPLVGADGVLLVSDNTGEEACLSERGELVGGSATFATVTGASISLVAGLTYEQIGWVVSCTRDTHFQIVQTDDTTDTIHADIILEAGQSVHTGELHCLGFTAGSTGVQVLKLVGKNLDVLSDMRGTITVTEDQP